MVVTLIIIQVMDTRMSVIILQAVITTKLTTSTTNTTTTTTVTQACLGGERELSLPGGFGGFSSFHS